MTHLKTAWALLPALLLLPTSASAIQGPAQLWILDDDTSLPAGPGGDTNGIREVDEQVPEAGALVSTEGVSNAPEIEYAGDVFYVSTASALEPSSLEIVNAGTGLVQETLILDYSGAISGAGSSPVATALELVGSVLYAGIVGEQGGGGGNPSELATIDPVTGLVTSVGLTGIDRPLGGLAYDGTLYAINAGGASPASLFTVDLGTGAAALVGSTGVQLTGLEFGVDGLLYALGRGSNNDELFTLDPTTGAATLLGALDGGADGAAITSAFFVPEPATALLVGLGLLALARRRTAR